MEDGQKEYEFTRKMHCIMEDCNSRLKSFYCREDFEEAMKRYRSAPDDAKPSRRRDLQRMCTTNGTAKVQLKAPSTDCEECGAVPTDPKYLADIRLISNRNELENIGQTIIRMLENT